MKKTENEIDIGVKMKINIELENEVVKLDNQVD